MWNLFPAVYPVIDPALFPLCYGRLCGWAFESTATLAQAPNSEVIFAGFLCKFFKEAPAFEIHIIHKNAVK